MSLVNAGSVKKSIGDLEIIKGIDLKLEQNETMAITGRSGSGKSTLLYLLGGLDQATEGSIEIDGTNLGGLSDDQLSKFRNDTIGFIFQFHFLLPAMTGLDNIYLPARIGKKLGPEVEAHVQKLVETLGVSHCLNKYPHEMSGGEQQRINLIRALSLSPKLLLCDEPTGNLDSKNAMVVIELLVKLSSENQSGLIVVTHDQSVAAHLQRKITIDDGKLIG